MENTYIDRIISPRWEAWAHKTNLTPPLAIEVPVPRQGIEWTCICGRGTNIASFYDFDIVF